MAALNKEAEMKKQKIKTFSILTIKWLIGLIALSLIFIYSSLILNYYELCAWVSNLFMTLGGGIVTGLIVYLLTNVREASHTKMKDDFRLLLELRDICNKNVWEIKYIAKQTSIEEDLDDLFSRLFNNLESAQSILYDRMSDALYCKCGLDQDDPLEYIVTDSIHETYRNSEDLELSIIPIITKISDCQSVVVERISPVIQEYKAKIELCSKFGI